MTFLVGQRGTGWTHIAQGQGSGGSAMCYRSGYLATPGTAATAYLHIFEEVTASTAKVCIYDAGGNLVGQSGAIDVTSPGLKSAALTSSVELTAQTYKLVVTLNSGYAYFAANSGSNNFQDDNWNSAAFSYASPPPALPTPTYEEINREFVVWLDGSAGSGAQALEGAATAGAAADAAISVTKPIAGAAQGGATAAADLTVTTGGVSHELGGDAAGAGSASASLSVTKPLAGAAAGSASAQGGLAVAKPLSGDAQGQASATGELTLIGHVDLAGATTGSGLASAALSITIPLGGAAVTAALADAALTVTPAVAIEAPRGGDAAPDRGHRGWDKRRATLRRKREREFTEQIRDLYRALTSDPATAERAEAIVAAVVPAVPARGESQAAHEAALLARAEMLRQRADALDAEAVQAEIALRLLYREYRERQEREDLDALGVLLPALLGVEPAPFVAGREALAGELWDDGYDMDALQVLLAEVL